MLKRDKTPTFSDSLEKIKKEYHKKGWWNREKLQVRYEKKIFGRESELAVADNRGIQLSHSELINSSHILEKTLLKQGVRKGDVVIILLPNWVEWQIALLGILYMGGIPANLPVRVDEKNLHYACEITGARAIITTEKYGSISTKNIAMRAAESCSHRNEILIFNTNSSKWVKTSEKPIPEIPNVEDLDHIMLTSSTTGLPKAVMHSSDTLRALNQAFSERFSLRENDPIFMASPLGHSVGTIHGARLSLYNGAPLILQDFWDPKEALKIISDYKCVFTAAATPFLKDLIEVEYKNNEPKLLSMKWFLCGGAQVPTNLMKKAIIEFPKTFVTLLWGMTEGGLTTSLPETPSEKLNTCAGLGLPGLELEIIDSEEKILGPGEVGELVMRGPGVFIGYFGQNDLYNSLLTKSGFFKTGDLATLDDEGYLKIKGRLKDLIIRGGVNISPVPIEDALSSHPNVEGVALVGYPDERLGELICAVIIPKGKIPTIDYLNKFLKEKGLPKYYFLEKIIIEKNFPLTPAGKIKKNVLIEKLKKKIK